MFRRIIFLTVICYSSFVNSQNKVAILDFENTSGISKYDGFGKALSNMLITDLKNSIHPRKVTFLERSQLNKILSEQNLQKSKNFDKSTAVSFGKLAGVKFVLVGSVYVLDGTCNISSRLVDVQTSEIVHAKESNGKITNWLSLKSILANELSTAMNNPVTIEADFTNKETSEAVLTQYVKVIDKMDEGDVDGAQEMTEVLSAIQPDFKYFDELKNDIEELYKRINKVEQDVEVTTTDPISAAQNYDQLGNFKEAERYYQIGLKRLNKDQVGEYLLYKILLSELCFKYEQYEKTIEYCDDVLNVYSLMDRIVILKGVSYLNLNRQLDFLNWSKSYLKQAKYIADPDEFDEQIGNYKDKNNIKVNYNDGIMINTSFLKGFQIELNNYYWHQGDGNIFSSVLNEFLEINTKINGLNTTLTFLKDINSVNTISKYELKSPNPFFLPKSQYVSTHTEKANHELLTLETGELYNGPYFYTSNGKIWNKSEPDKCPCVRLVTKDDYNKLSTIKIKRDWQKSSFLAEGWYSLINKETKNARKRFGQLIYYLVHATDPDYQTLYNFIDIAIYNLDSYRINGYQGLRDIIDSLSAGYNGTQKITFIDLLVKEKFHLKSDELVNNILNYAHTFLVEGKSEEAIKLYKLFPSNYELKEFESSVSQVIQGDLNEFVSKKIISSAFMENVLKKLDY